LPTIRRSPICVFTQPPTQAAFVLILLLASLAFSAVLQRHIRDRARRAWNLPLLPLDRPQPEQAPTALATARATLTSILVAFGAWALSGPPWLFTLFAVLAVVFGLMWGFSRILPTDPAEFEFNPAKPNRFLKGARKARTSKPAIRIYRFVAQKLAPGLTFFASFILAVSLMNRAAFDLTSAGGAYCKKANPKVEGGRHS
jgi:hypothetical protein